MEVKSSFPLDSQVCVDDVVRPRQEADKAGQEEDEPLDAGQTGVTVGNYARQDQA